MVKANILYYFGSFFVFVCFGSLCFAHPTDKIFCHLDPVIKKVEDSDKKIFASSAKDPEGKYNYGVINLLDHNPSTCWCPAGNGVDSFVLLKIPFRAKGIRILNGLQSNQKLYSENNRIKKLYLGFIAKEYYVHKGGEESNNLCPDDKFEIMFQTVPESMITMNDQMGWAEIFFDKIEYFSWDNSRYGTTGFVKSKDEIYLLIGVCGIYKGSKYDDLCISDVEIIK